MSAGVLQAFFTHFRMWVATATSVPSWLVILMSAVERRRSSSMAAIVYSTVMVSPKVHRREKADAVVAERHAGLVRASRAWAIASVEAVDM